MPSPIIALDLIKSSMRLVGIISGNQTPKANESNDALNVLNDLLEEWSIDNLKVWGLQNVTYPLVVGQSLYSIGAGGNFVDTRPFSLNTGYVSFNGVDFDVTFIGQDIYNKIPVKATRGIPREILYVPSFPLGYLYLYPVPDQVYTLSLGYDEQLNAIASLATTVTYPPGYAKALRWNLAVDLAAEFGAPVADDVRQIAMSSLASIKQSNNRDMTTSSFDPTLTGGGYQDGWQGGY